MWIIIAVVIVVLLVAIWLPIALGDTIDAGIDVIDHFD